MNEALFSEQLYKSYKRLLFTLAYRMLGSVADAEDVAHEAFISLNAASPDEVHNVKAYLCKIATNRCLDRLRSARSRREAYVGPWLPEPIVEASSQEGDPYRSYEQTESLSIAYLLLLQQLSATERIVFLLREALQYEYEEIADIVSKSATNCRQIFSRAKRAIGHHSPAETASVLDFRPKEARTEGREDQLADLVGKFIGALSTGNLGQLMNVLSTDATLFSDGGGKVSAATRPIAGAERIAKFFDGLMKKTSPGFSFRVATVNGSTGIVTYEDGRASSVISFHAKDGVISAVYIVVNPDKLLLVQ
ncbi:RNA polymerase sigma-70 factor [Cohnella soli]|uniref:RNA polymerase sigma-70 factor n=1 Tax=Cohnella soli TaxID=425005 RepID=A0ABW0HZ84_9BACL